MKGVGKDLMCAAALLMAVCCQGWGQDAAPDAPSGHAATSTVTGSFPGPHGFEALAVSSSEIRCYWLPVAGATDYELWGANQKLHLSANTTSYAFTGLTSGVPYSFVLRAHKGPDVSLPLTYDEAPFSVLPTSLKPSSNNTFDVVVIQASSGGVAAAVEAARRGLRVALVEPTTRPGGMPVNSLSATDLRRPYHASGFFVRFRDKVKSIYSGEGVQGEGLEYEPRVALQAMKSLLYAQKNITLFRRARLAHVNSVSQAPFAPNRRRVVSVDVDQLNSEGQPDGKRARLYAGIFIDSTDCGDLAAWAGAPFRIGREPRTKDEPHNGVIYYDRAHDKALPGSTGKADKRIQSYAYLLTVKDYGAGADKTIPKPEGYRKEDFIHSPDWKDSWAVTSGQMPNSKMELNQHPEGNDLQQINYHYPTGTYTERERVEKRYRNRILCYLYYIQTALGQKQVGLPDDEYRDSGGLPSLLYVREGRRIEGEQTPTENEIAQAARLIRPESIGIGDYPMDSHAVERKTNWDTPDMGEGEWWLYQYTPAHSLPLGIIVPKTLDNVFVTTAVSSTHVSFGTYRLEPVRMAFGQAAGIAASLCLRYHLTGREVPARQIQDELLPHPSNPIGDPSVMLSYLSDVKPENRFYREIQELAVRGFTFSAEELKPNAPTTCGELSHWLAQLVKRAAPRDIKLLDTSHYQVERRAYFPYMGSWAYTDSPKNMLLSGLAMQTVSRANFAINLAGSLNWPSEQQLDDIHYVDVKGWNGPICGPAPLSYWTTALWQHGIDARLWDGMKAFAPDGKYYFRPDAPITHAEVLAALYIAQLWLGPKFDDNPIDGRNGRALPSIPYETDLSGKPYSEIIPILVD